MYNSLLSKKKTIEQLEQTIGNINKDMNNNKKQSDEKISGLLYENEKVKEQNKSLSSTIDTMKNEQSRLKDITKDTISDMKRMEKDMEMVQQRYDTLEKEYNKICSIYITYSKEKRRVR